MAKSLDWSKLPPNLAWVAAPAEQYGHYQFDEPIREFLLQATPDEMAQLRSFQKRWIDASPAIEAWLDTYNMTKHAEARLVYFTQVLLGTADDCGLL